MLLLSSILPLLIADWVPDDNEHFLQVIVNHISVITDDQSAYNTCMCTRLSCIYASCVTNAWCAMVVIAMSLS